MKNYVYFYHLNVIKFITNKNKIRIIKSLKKWDKSEGWSYKYLSLKYSNNY